jgi:hypothetical protein
MPRRRNSRLTLSFDEPTTMRNEPTAAAILCSILAWRAHNSRLIAALVAGR